MIKSQVPHTKGFKYVSSCFTPQQIYKEQFSFFFSLWGVFVVEYIEFYSVSVLILIGASFMVCSVTLHTRTPCIAIKSWHTCPSFALLAAFLYAGNVPESLSSHAVLSHRCLRWPEEDIWVPGTRLLWASQCGYWELSLGLLWGQQMLSTAELPGP